MYSAFSETNLHTARIFAAIFLIGALLFSSVPLHVIAEDGSGTNTTQQQEGDTSGDAEGSAGDEGSDGSDGSGGEGDATVTTGDATATADVVNESNTNSTDTTGDDQNTENADGDQSDTEEGAEGTSDDTATTTQAAGDDPSTESNDSVGQAGTTTPETTGDTASTTQSGGEELQDLHEGSNCQPAELEGDSASSTDAVEGDIASTTATGEEETPTTCIKNTNIGTTTNAVGVDAATGSSTATTTNGNASVTSGNALAHANVINVINTNIFNSNGLLLLLNALFGQSSFDLRDFLSFWQWQDTASETEGQEQGISGDVGTSSSPCSLDSCEGEGTKLNIISSNKATIQNDVIVRSETGRNVAASVNGSAGVNTGDAYAGANVVNVANTNLTEANYLLVSLNNFGDFAGDIVFPGKSFFSKLFGGSGSLLGGASVTSDNEADIENAVDVAAGTGGNAATSTDDGAAVATGNAQAGANVVNQVNTNLFNTDSVYVLFRVHGNWSGEVHGLPEGISWRETGAGIELFSTPDDVGTSTNGSLSQLSIKNTNGASIKNNVGVYALTGENKVDGGSSASVTTGNAAAGANVINVANTNVVGRNWIFAVFNIFGDWSGNLSFGRPDLWIGGQATSDDNPIGPGSEITYTFTITNNGDADANNVTLAVAPGSNHLAFQSVSKTQGDKLLWDLGTIAAGETTNVSYTAEVSDEAPYGNTPVTTTAEVGGKETDENDGDNTETLGVVINRPAPGTVRVQSGGGGDNDGPPGSEDNPTMMPDLVVTKMRSGGATITASSTIEYTVSIVNRGDFAYDSVLTDTLKNAAGEILSRQQWDLNDVYPDEEVTVTYEVFFNASTTPGIYTNRAQVTALARYRSPDLARNGDSNVATAQVVVVADKEEEPEEVSVLPEEPAVEANEAAPAAATTTASAGYGTIAATPSSPNAFDYATSLLASTLLADSTFTQWLSLILMLILVLLLLIAGRRFESRGR